MALCKHSKNVSNYYCWIHGKLWIELPNKFGGLFVEPQVNFLNFPLPLVCAAEIRFQHSIYSSTFPSHLEVSWGCMSTFVQWVTAGSNSCLSLLGQTIKESHNSTILFFLLQQLKEPCTPLRNARGWGTTFVWDLWVTAWGTPALESHPTL